MFLGEYRHNIDSKYRLTVPVRFRELLSEGAFITRGFDRNLMVLTPKAFEELVENILHKSITDPLNRALRRLIIGSSSQVEIDKVGRILIPNFLCQITGITSDQEVVLIGQGNYFEIWSSAEWSIQQKSLDEAEANSERFKVLDLSTSSG
jgi:MraZ protein